VHKKDLQALLAYLRDNSGQYPLGSLRSQMVKAGHVPAEVDHAIAVFEGKALPPEPPVWPAVLFVVLFDCALAGLCALLFSRYGTGQVSCSALVLVPAVYLTELVAGLISLASGKERLGRALLLGFVFFCAVGALGLLLFLARWLGKLAGS